MTQPIEIARLSAPTRRRLQELLAGKCLLRAPNSAAGGLIGASFLILLALGGAALLFFLGVGVVDSGRPAHSIIAAIGHGAAAALLWWTAASVARDLRQLRGGLTGGLSILPGGAIDVRAGRVRVINPDHIVRWETRADGGAAAGHMGLIHVDLVLDDETRVGTVLYGTMANVKRGELDELIARGEELRAARKRDDRDAIARLCMVPDDELARAARFASSAPGGSRRLAGTVVAGLLGAAAAFLFLLPAQSLRAARTGRWIGMWDAAEASHPLPWVRAEADRARAELRARVRAAALARLAPAWREGLAPLLDAGLASADRRIRVRALAPSPAEVQAATKQLEAAAPAGTKAAPILLEQVSSYSLHSTSPVASAVADKLNGALGLDESAGALRFEGEDMGTPADDVARVEVPFTIAVEAILSGEGHRVFAALATSFAPRAVVPGRPPLPLGEPIDVAAAKSMEVMRTNVGSLRQRALDSTGVYSIDAIEDSMIYRDQLGKASATAAEKLATRLTAP